MLNIVQALRIEPVFTLSILFSFDQNGHDPFLVSARWWSWIQTLRYSGNLASLVASWRYLAQKHQIFPLSDLSFDIASILDGTKQRLAKLAWEHEKRYTFCFLNLNIFSSPCDFNSAITFLPFHEYLKLSHLMFFGGFFVWQFVDYIFSRIQH